MEPELRIRRTDELGLQATEEGHPLADVFVCERLCQGQVVLIAVSYTHLTLPTKA